MTCRTPAILTLALLLTAGIPRGYAAEERPRIGLVLGGGGARGAAHVGVIQTLDELRVPIDCIAGTSMGALVGGLYASGMTADELTRLLDTADWSALLTDRTPRARRSFRRRSDDIGFLVDFDLGVRKSGFIFPEGLIQGQNLEIEIKRLVLPVVHVADFDELPIPFRAVAADIATGEAAVLAEGDLATAMRASMSVPGIFRPVRRDGQLLVDGGVAINLPVQVAREMGADILIVVDVGSPLRDEEQLGSAFAITKQMLGFLVNSRVEDQVALLSDRDILISPDLGDFGARDFQHANVARKLGQEKANELSELLAGLAVSDEEYRAHRKQVERVRNGPPQIDRVRVQSGSRLSPKVVASRLDDHAGAPLDLDRLESDIAEIYGFETFETVTYDVLEEPEATTLLVRATEKSWGPNYIRFGLNLEDNFEGDSNYNAAARFTRTEVNRRGGEFRAEIQVGETSRLFAEFFQPLDFASRWFVNPQLEYQRGRSGSFGADGAQIAQFGSDEIRASLFGGRQFGNRAELRVGISRLRSDSELRIGTPIAPGKPVKITNLSATASFDTIDRIAVPRSGANLALRWAGARESLGSDLEFDLAELFLLAPRSWGHHTLLNWWNFAKTTKDDSGALRPFPLGGLFSLSGYAPGELTGRHYGIGRLLYYYRLGEPPLPGFDTPIYLGASIEAGNVWQSTAAIGLDDTLVAGSLFVVFDSFLGPLYLAYGAGEGGRHSAYLFLGQTF